MRPRLGPEDEEPPRIIDRLDAPLLELRAPRLVGRELRPGDPRLIAAPPRLELRGAIEDLEDALREDLPGVEIRLAVPPEDLLGVEKRLAVPAEDRMRGGAEADGVRKRVEDEGARRERVPGDQGALLVTLVEDGARVSRVRVA